MAKPPITPFNPLGSTIRSVTAITQEITMKKHTESGNILQFRRPESQLLRRHRGLFKSPRKPTHQAQATVDAYKAFVTALSESLYAMPSIHFPVPNGIITVQMSHGVTSRTAREALALIRQAILENGIPKDPMVQVTGVNTRGAKEKSSEPRRHSFVEANTKRPNDAKMRVDTEEPSEENRVIEAMSDEELEAEVAKIRDMHVISMMVSNGIVSVIMYGAEVTRAVAISALALIGAVIQKIGVPKEKMVPLGGCLNIAQNGNF